MVSFLVALLTWSSLVPFYFVSCGNLKPVRSFDMQAMTGIWYVVETSYSHGDCAVYNITRDPSSSEKYNVDIKSNGVYFGFTKYFQESATITVPDKSAGRLKINMNNSGDDTFNIFKISYSDYAGLYSPINHKAMILSRTPRLYRTYLLQLVQRLEGSEATLKSIRQTGCPNRGCRGHRRFC